MKRKVLVLILFQLVCTSGATVGREPCFDPTAEFNAHFEDCVRKAKAGNRLAQYNVGVMYDRGVGIDQDYQRALNWYLRAAEQGDREAQISAAGIYFHGLVPEIGKDYREAARWYRKAAIQGDQEAAYRLGWIYQTKNSVSDLKQALYWYTKAARHRHPQAQSSLGLLYLSNHGIRRDYFKAYLIFSIGATTGNPDAIELRDFAGGQLSVTELHQADQILQACDLQQAIGIECGIFD